MGKCGGRELNYISDVDVAVRRRAASTASRRSRPLQPATRLAQTLMRACVDADGRGHDLGGRPQPAAGGQAGRAGAHPRLLRRLLPALGVDLGVPGAAQGAARRRRPRPRRALRRARHADGVGGGRPAELRRGRAGHAPPRRAERAGQGRRPPAQARGRRPARRRVQRAAAAARARPQRRDAAQRDHARRARVARHVGVRRARGRQRSEHVVRASCARSSTACSCTGCAAPTSSRTRDDDLRRIARSMGMRSDPVAELTDALRRHRREVRRLHEKLFYRPLLNAVARLDAGEARLTPEAARQRLEALGYTDPAGALRHLEALTSGVTRRAAIQRTLLPVMLGWFAGAPDPDAGLLAFRRMSDALGSTPWYLRLLRDESLAAQRLARVLASSRYAADLLLRAPEARHDARRRRRARAARARGARRARRSPRPGATTTRRWRSPRCARCAAASCSAPRSPSCSAWPRSTRRASRSRRSRRRPSPARSRSPCAPWRRERGSAAADADARRGDGPLRRRRARLRQRRRRACSCTTRCPAPTSARRTRRRSPSPTSCAGCSCCPTPDPPLEIDADLRPEGRNGPLVRTLASYAAYYERWSSAWEAQALLRAEPVAGDADARCARSSSSSTRCATPRAASPRPPCARSDGSRRGWRPSGCPRGADPGLHTKLGRGGLSDVEWVAQLLQLQHGHEAARTADDPHRCPRSAAAVDAGLLDAEDAEHLVAAWRIATRVRDAVMLVTRHGERHGADRRARPRRRVPGARIPSGRERSAAGRLPSDHASGTRGRGEGVLRVSDGRDAGRTLAREAARGRARRARRPRVPGSGPRPGDERGRRPDRPRRARPARARRHRLRAARRRHLRRLVRARRSSAPLCSARSPTGSPPQSLMLRRRRRAGDRRSACSRSPPAPTLPLWVLFVLLFVAELFTPLFESARAASDPGHPRDARSSSRSAPGSRARCTSPTRRSAWCSAASSSSSRLAGSARSSTRSRSCCRSRSSSFCMKPRPRRSSRPSRSATLVADLARGLVAAHGRPVAARARAARLGAWRPRSWRPRRWRSPTSATRASPTPGAACSWRRSSPVPRSARSRRTPSARASSSTCCCRSPSRCACRCW